jgi:hypothetical protein
MMGHDANDKHSKIKGRKEHLNDKGLAENRVYSQL